MELFYLFYIFFLLSFKCDEVMVNPQTVKERSQERKIVLEYKNQLDTAIAFSLGFVSPVIFTNHLNNLLDCTIKSDFLAHITTLTINDEFNDVWLEPQETLKDTFIVFTSIEDFRIPFSYIGGSEIIIKFTGNKCLKYQIIENTDPNIRPKLVLQGVFNIEEYDNYNPNLIGQSNYTLTYIIDQEKLSQATSCQ